MAVLQQERNKYELTAYQLKSKLTIRACEDFLSFSERAEEDFEVKIPTHFEHSIAGGEAAFAQAMCTWARRQSTSIVSTYAKSKSDPQIQKIVSSLFGLTAALTATSIVSDTGENIYEAVLTPALERLRALQSTDPYKFCKGSEVQIVCADHLGYGAPLSLYLQSVDHRNILRERSEFQYVARRIIKKTAGGAAMIGWSAEIELALGVMLQELFANTQQHGLRELNRDLLSHSVRGIHGRFYGLLPEALERISEGYAPLQNYFVRLAQNSRKQQVTFLEISIFDSGIGFAPSFLHRELSDILPYEELAAIQRCFTMRATSKSTSESGFGLPRVVKFLHRTGGFIRLRTGRHSMFADLSISKLNSEFELIKFTPQDVEVLPSVVGALITLIIPLM